MFRNILIIILFLIFCLFSYTYLQKSGQSAICYKVSKGDITDSVTGNIKILAKQTSNLKSNISGYVKNVLKLPLEKSVFVKKGQKILELDSSDLNRSLSMLLKNKSFLKAKIDAGSIYALELELEQEELNASLKLSEGQHISTIDLKKKKNLINRLKTQINHEKISNDQEYSNLNGKIEELKSKIEKMTIKSPIDGELIHSYVTPGDFIAVGQPVASIISNDRTFEASLNEEDFNGLKENLPAAITLFSTGRKVIEAKVSRLASSVDSQSGRRLAYLEINKRNNSFPTGASGRVEIIRKTIKNCLLIPSKALIGNSVFVVKNDKTTIKQVETGAKNLNFVEVIDGLAEGEIVVIETPHLFSENQSIQPIFLREN